MTGASIPHTMCPKATKVLESNWLGVFLVEFSTVENNVFNCNCKTEFNHVYYNSLVSVTVRIF